MPVNPDEWLTVKKKLRDALSLYEKCEKKWRKSGFHEDLPEPQPFSDYSHNNKLVLYIHEYMMQFDDVFEKMTGNFIN